jgi:hypothetical protein
MPNSFDLPPVYDGITKLKVDYLSDVWVSYWSTFIQDLSDYLTQFGVFLPQLTTVQRDSIQSPQNGQMIYNTSIGSAQYFKAGTWTSF